MLSRARTCAESAEFYYCTSPQERSAPDAIHAGPSRPYAPPEYPSCTSGQLRAAPISTHVCLPVFPHVAYVRRGMWIPRTALNMLSIRPRPMVNAISRSSPPYTSSPVFRPCRAANLDMPFTAGSPSAMMQTPLQAAVSFSAVEAVAGIYRGAEVARHPGAKAQSRPEFRRRPDAPPGTGHLVPHGVQPGGGQPEVAGDEHCVPKGSSSPAGHARRPLPPPRGGGEYAPSHSHHAYGDGGIPAPGWCRRSASRTRT